MCFSFFYFVRLVAIFVVSLLRKKNGVISENKYCTERTTNVKFTPMGTTFFVDFNPISKSHNQPLLVYFT